MRSKLDQYPDKLTFRLIEYPLKDGTHVSIMRGYIVSVRQVANKPNECEVRTTTGNIWPVALSYNAVIEALTFDFPDGV